MKALRTAAFILGLVALGIWLHPTIRALMVVSFCLAAFLHFSIRIIRNRAAGRGRASAVSLALAFLSLGPCIVVGLVHGVFPARIFPGLAAGAWMLAAGLVIAIIRVEQMDEARRRHREAAEEAREALRRIHQEEATR